MRVFLLIFLFAVFVIAQDPVIYKYSRLPIDTLKKMLETAPESQKAYIQEAIDQRTGNTRRPYVVGGALTPIGNALQTLTGSLKGGKGPVAKLLKILAPVTGKLGGLVGGRKVRAAQAQGAAQNSAQQEGLKGLLEPVGYTLTDLAEEIKTEPVVVSSLLKPVAGIVEDLGEVLGGKQLLEYDG